MQFFGKPSIINNYMKNKSERIYIFGAVLGGKYQWYNDIITYKKATCL